MKVQLLLIILSLSLAQLTVITSQSTCTCSQYLSQKDCISTSNTGGACTWGTVCTQPTCFTVTASGNSTIQQACNSLNGCAWSSAGTCINTSCNLLNSTSAGGLCANRFCLQSTTQSIDGSYPCTTQMNTTQTIQPCTAQMNSTACGSLPYCAWGTSCTDTTCALLIPKFCNFVFVNSSATPPVAQICLNGTTCSNMYAANLTESNCVIKTMFYYTWSTVKNSCVYCVTGSSNIMIVFLLGFITIFA